MLTGEDLDIFNQGTHFRLYEKLGAHVVSHPAAGVRFAVWAPHAASVAVIGDFNEWDQSKHPLQGRGASGIWEGFIPNIAAGAAYKYHIVSQHQGYAVDKADPFGFLHQTPPQTASIVCPLDTYHWNDRTWMNQRKTTQRLDQPLSIYELHLGSWMRVPEEANRSLTYLELAPRLIEYVQQTGFTHVELMPVMEHPFYGSWGYQITGYFAPTSRYGSPHDFMALVDQLHRAGIGVILDWVPSHFPNDEHGLAYFDGTHLFEHADPRQGQHPDWQSAIFNYGRPEVRSFLTSCAFFWLHRYHIDALRTDAVASMLYLDYSRRAGEWVPNQFGGNENLDAISFLRQFNAEVYRHFPDVQTIAEESTAWPMVSRPTSISGLGFGYKWDMGWMHDTLRYFSHAPIHRRFHHNQLTFRGMYAFTENFILPLSHDEIVHGQGSLLSRMPGTPNEQFMNLRLLLACMFGAAGKKLLFMGGEIGQWQEWKHDTSLDWHLLREHAHAGIRQLVSDLNRLYRTQHALHEKDHDPAGFSWIDCNDSDQSTLSWIRTGSDPNDPILLVCNFTPVPRSNYRLGVPSPGFWIELLNTDAETYGGAARGNLGGVESAPFSWHGRPHSLTLYLPPLTALFFKRSSPASAQAPT